MSIEQIQIRLAKTPQKKAEYFRTPPIELKTMKKSMRMI
jgi:hypothetical protein